MVLGRGRGKWVYEGVMVALAVLVVVLLPLAKEGWVLVANLTVWGVFVVDYFTRLALSTDRRAFFKRNIVDLLAILPADFFRALRVLRLARLLRVIRAATIVGRILRDARGVSRTNGLGWVFVVSFCCVLAGALVVRLVEPGLGSFPDSVWWAVVTATTVGYGDLAPENPLARVVAVVLMLVGIGTIGMLTGSIATYFIGDGGSDDPISNTSANGSATGPIWRRPSGSKWLPCSPPRLRSPSAATCEPLGDAPTGDRAERGNRPKLPATARRFAP